LFIRCKLFWGRSGNAQLLLADGNLFRRGGNRSLVTNHFSTKMWISLWKRTEYRNQVKTGQAFLLFAHLWVKLKYETYAGQNPH
jgi:hypothetical protein